jgi:hypothetical protein
MGLLLKVTIPLLPEAFVACKQKRSPLGIPSPHWQYTLRSPQSIHNAPIALLIEICFHVADFVLRNI